MRVLRDVVISTALAALSGYAIYQRVQLVAIVALLLLVGVFFRGTARRAIDRGESTLRRVNRAKLKDVLEVSLGSEEPKSVRYVPDGDEPLSLLIFLRDAQPATVLFLLAVDREGQFALTEAQKGRARYLRDAGLLHHDGQKIADSEKVWLTEYGKPGV